MMKYNFSFTKKGHDKSIKNYQNFPLLHSWESSLNALMPRTKILELVYKKVAWSKWILLSGCPFVRRELQSFEQQIHRIFAPKKRFFRESRSSFGIDPCSSLDHIEVLHV